MIGPEGFEQPEIKNQGDEQLEIKKPRQILPHTGKVWNKKKTDILIGCILFCQLKAIFVIIRFKYFQICDNIKN